MKRDYFSIPFKKIILFFIRNSKHPLFLSYYLYYFWQNEFSVTASFFDEQELLAFIQEGKSLIRIGDGEIGLLNDKGITGTVFLQRPLSIFKRKFKEMVSTYHKESPYVLAIPKKYLSYHNKLLREEGKLRSWLPLKIMYILIFPKGMKYADSHIFYQPKFFEKNIVPIIKDRTVIFVINETKVEALKQKNFTRKIYFVKTPPSDAGAKYIEIRKEIKEALLLYSDENPILLFSCGPIGKVLLYDFSLEGYQGIDVGEAANVLYEDTRIDYLV